MTYVYKRKTFLGITLPYKVLVYIKLESHTPLNFSHLFLSENVHMKRLEGDAVGFIYFSSKKKLTRRQRISSERCLSTIEMFSEIA